MAKEERKGIIPSGNDLYFAKTRKEAKIPGKRPEDAGYDIYPCFGEQFMVIGPHETVMVPTGIASALSPEYYLQVEERGSTGSKGIKKSAGIIDSGYRGEIFIAVTNTRKETLVISRLDKKETLREMGEQYEGWEWEEDIIYYPYEKAIAQLIVHRVHEMSVREISYEELKAIPSERGTGKLGSTE